MNMANDLTKNPLIIDTAAPTVLLPATQPMRVKSVRWVGATTAGHLAEIQDANNNVLWSSVAAGANNVEGELEEVWWREGMKVPTLQSGVLYITYH
jgi:hypothetical protein